jgi:hydrogenase maturation protease
MTKTLVIGLGNPVRGDYGFGWKVAETVKERLNAESLFRLPVRPVGTKSIYYLYPVEVDCISLGGLSLMERLLGYERAIIVESMETGQNPVGSVRTFPLASWPYPMAGHFGSDHDTSLITALKTAENIGVDLPRRVDVVAVEAQNVYTCGKELSPPVAAAVVKAVQAVFNLLQGAHHDLS